MSLDVFVDRPLRLLIRHNLLAKEPELARSLAEVEGPSLDDLAHALGEGLPHVA